MRLISRLPSLFVFAVLLASGAPHLAEAQSRSSVLERLEALEAQMNALEPPLGDTPQASAEPSAIASAAGNGHAQVALSELREELRQLRGDVEEIGHTQRRQQEQLEQLSKEIDLRFNALEAAANAAAATAAAEVAPTSGEVAAAPSATSATKEAGFDPFAPVEDGAAGANSAATAASADEAQDANALYKAAFETLNKGDYAGAEQQFGAFIQRFPKHALVGNAHYWLGETYYVQERFDAAADAFRKGFQAMPKGTKAADNLLRLGMALGVLERKDEACIIFDQLLKKYAAQSQAVERKANHERSKIGCK